MLGGYGNGRSETLNHLAGEVLQDKAQFGVWAIRAVTDSVVGPREGLDYITQHTAKQKYRAGGHKSHPTAQKSLPIPTLLYSTGELTKLPSITYMVY